MRLAFFGDCHGHLDLMYQHTLAWEREHDLNIDAVIQVGDFGIWPTLEGLDGATRKHAAAAGQEDPRGDFPAYLSGEKIARWVTFFIRGNHEDQDYLLKEQAHGYAGEVCQNIHYIPDGHIEQIGHLTVAGLGGNWSRSTFDMGKTKAQQQGRRRNHIDPVAWRKLMQGPGFDILLTHDAPNGIGLVNRRDPGVDGSPRIRELIEAKVRKMSFSGHWHFYLEATIGKSHHYSLSKTDPTVEREKSMVVIQFKE